MPLVGIWKGVMTSEVYYLSSFSAGRCVENVTVYIVTYSYQLTLLFMAIYNLTSCCGCTYVADKAVRLVCVRMDL
jgi:hypothetical protein